MKGLISSVAALLVLASSATYAHTELEASMPADKAVLDQAPKEIVLTFSEAAKLTAVAIQKAGGAKQDVGPLPSDPSEKFTLAAPALMAGEYVISWRALSDDMHVASGEIHFQVKGMASAAH
jgi:methionine-rich copper-binding protein CopC